MKRPTWSVLVVGPPTMRRQKLVNELIADGRAVVLCPAAPSCPLERHEDCFLKRIVDATIGLADEADDPVVRQRIERCQRQGRATSGNRG